MIEQAATWLLFVVSVLGLWISGSSPKTGWWFALLNQLALWLVYAAWTRQWGLVATSLVFAALYARNLWKWRNTPMPRPAHGSGHTTRSPKDFAHAGAQQTGR